MALKNRSHFIITFYFGLYHLPHKRYCQKRTWSCHNKRLVFEVCLGDPHYLMNCSLYFQPEKKKFISVRNVEHFHQNNLLQVRKDQQNLCTLHAFFCGNVPFDSHSRQQHFVVKSKRFIWMVQGQYMKILT